MTVSSSCSEGHLLKGRRRDQRTVDPGLVSRALEVAGRLANDAADVISATAGRDTRPLVTNSPFDWVTDTDRTLERHTRRILASEFPGMPVVAERFADVQIAEDSEAEYHWVVDPVDGTANYLAGIPWCSYSLALVDRDGPVVGVVADPYRAQIYAAARGRGMRANGTPIRLPHRTSIAGSIVCTELGRSGMWPGMPDFVGLAAREHAQVRVLGSASLAVSQVALGHAAAAILHGCRTCDVAGAAALATESGADVLDHSGNPVNPMTTGALLVAAPGVAAKILAWWHPTP